jgi:LacI family transcriptional regulator
MARTRQPTINDVARVAGVSKKTVSRVINRSSILSDRMRKRVEAVIDELGYVPNPQARALALRRNFLIGLVHDNPNAQTVMNVQQGLLEAIQDTEFEMVVRPVDSWAPTMIEDLRHFFERQRLFGVLLMSPVSDNDAVAMLCEDIGCRYMRVGSAAFGSPQRMVTSNDCEAVREATDYLISMGHRRIGLVAGPRGFRSASERRQGFEEALRAVGIALPRSMVAEGNYLFESGVVAAGRLLDQVPRPTAIFSSNDEMAAGVIHGACQRGLVVPRDLSVIGFDDTAIAAHMWPPLTTVRRPIASMARAAALKLITDIAEDEGSGDAGQPSMFPSTLIRRSSVAPPRD